MVESKPPADVRIRDRSVGVTHPCYVVAEIGSNHNREFDTAKRLIDVAAEAGAEAVKFQTFSGRTLYSTKAPPFEYLGELGQRPPHELLESLALPREWQPLLAEHCRERGVEFLSTPFDRSALVELAELDVPAVKIASFELVDLQFIGEAAGLGRPMILSTGMANLGEIEEAINAARAHGADQIILLQCASLYPAPPSIMNLRAIASLQLAFGLPVGLSDHTLGIHIPTAAVALGACVVEKHVTLDRSSPGPDHPFAVEPGELRDLVSQIRDVEAALGDGHKVGPSPLEAEEMYTKGRRSLVAARRIEAGEVIRSDAITAKRPGFGVQPRFLNALIGRVARETIEEDEVITWEML